ncbi:MAG: nucleotidyltransferase domain-containing protein [Thermodesulfobacteriota bacterium]
MPVRSLNSSVLRWPDRGQVDRAIRNWATDLVRKHAGVLRLGYFGSYARGNWGVGSDLDLVMIVDRTDEPFEQRATHWDLNELPVPAQMIVYTSGEWDSLQEAGGRFARTLAKETVWVFGQDDRE